MGVGFWWERVNWAPGMGALGGGLGLQGFVIYAELNQASFSRYVKVCVSLGSKSGTSSLLQLKQP